MSEPAAIRSTTKADWIRRREEIRARTLRALGLDPAPEKVPLEVRTGAAEDRPGYRLERTYWQTWPRVWASGWLYLPQEREGRLPGIVVYGGATEEGEPSSMPALCAGLAQRGLVTLAIDPMPVEDLAVGLVPSTVATWSGLRALDLLQSRPDVDRDRLGLVGHAGGAVSGMYLMAVDDRVRAAVLAEHPGYFRRLLAGETPTAPESGVPGVMRFTDATELLGVPSPRAVLYLTGKEGGLGDEELGELLALYRLWGQPDRLGRQSIDSTHALGPSVYDWLRRELRGKGEEPDGEPGVDPSGGRLPGVPDERPAEDQGVEGIRAWYHKRVVNQPPALESKQSRKAYQDRLRSEVRELLGEPLPAALESRVEQAREERWGVPWTEVSFRSERDVRLAAWWTPGGEGEGTPVLIALHPDGRQGALRSPVVRGFAERGWAVLAPDVRLRGALRQECLEASVLWGRPEAGMAADDALAAVRWVQQQPGIDPKSVVLLGEGDQGVTALLAAGLDERVSLTLADCRETTYRDGGEGLPVIPNILRSGDVPQLASMAAPRPMWLYRVPQERVGFASRRYYDWTRRTFQSLGEQDALNMTTGDLPDPASLLAWIDRRIRRAKR